MKHKRIRSRPIEAVHDPYVAAVLIGLAQGRRHANTLPEECRAYPTPTTPSVEPTEPPGDSKGIQVGFIYPCGFKTNRRQVYVFATTARSLYLYNACITHAFLDQLDKPSQPSHAESVCLCYRRLSLNSPRRMIRIITKNSQLNRC